MELIERILKNSIELFRKYGIKRVTTDDIARETGISKRTLYENFRDKEEIIKSCIEYFTNEKKREVVEIIDKSENVIEAVYKICKWGEEIRKSFNPLFFEDLKKYHYKIYNDVIKNNSLRANNIQLLLKKGINEGYFRKGLNCEIIAIFIDEVVKIMHNENIFDPIKYQEKDLFNNIIMPYFIGISSDKGKELIEKYFKEQFSL